MSLSAGTRLGPYEILSPLGAGGMGEVYRARDTRLGREVAVKVLPAALSQDADRLRRFEQEARAASALNHPNILTLHDIGTNSSDGAPYVVSELLEGETLRGPISAGALSPRKAIDYGIQIAQGLAAAHEKGIVHRDLKPENVFVTDDGRVKILDFGLAKLTQPETAPGQQTSIPTAPGTEPGVVMGTVGYMAPEQVKGQPADHRSDIFSFGAILYEMLSGRRAFRGDSAVETMSAILKEDPPELSETNKSLSPGLERLVRHCLEKAPAQRFQSARDLAYDLDAISTTSGGTIVGSSLGVTHPGRRPGAVRLFTIAAAVALGAIATWLAIGRRPAREGSQGAVRASILLPPGVAFDCMALSPDGTRLAFSGGNAQGTRMLWVRPLSSLKAESIAGTDSATLPFWSADGKSIGFFTDDKLWRVEAAGGPATTLAEVAGAGGTWNRNGDILYCGVTGPILRIPAAGGKPVPVTKLNAARHETSHRYPQFLPDGRHFIYLSLNLDRGPEDEGNQIHVAALDSLEERIVLRSVTNTVYSRGFLLFTKGAATYTRIGTLLAQPFDLKRLETRGEPVAIADQVGGSSGYYNYSNFAASENGTLAYETASVEARFVWLDRSGRRVGTFGEPAVYNWPRISPDGTRLVYARLNGTLGKNEIWIHDLTRNVSTRVTDGRYDSVIPLWSPDGARIAFSSDRKHQADLYAQTLSGAAADEALTDEEGEKLGQDWSPDGNGIVVSERQASGNRLVRLALLPVTGSVVDADLFAFRNNPRNARLSADGRWIAYGSDESGRFEVYVASFPDASRRWQISNSGGETPIWRRDGKELFYVAADGKFMAVNVQTSPSFTAGVPAVLFEPPRTNAYDVSADGQRFLVLLPTIESNSVPLNLVLHWTEGLEKKN
ncbi:MAG: protein kinase [Acidobacteriota bacterium]